MTKNKNHHLEQHGDAWYFIAMINGKRIKKSLGTSSLTEARKKRDHHLMEIQTSGDLQHHQASRTGKCLFGEVSKIWAEIAKTEVKKSTFIDYRDSMNKLILPRFGDIPIAEITYLDIKAFISELPSSNKRKNNILVPMRSVFKVAYLDGIIDANPMDRVKNLKVKKPDINPLSMEETERFTKVVSPHYRSFFEVAFFTGMRFGEMAALKWKNVDLKRRIVKIRETRVKGEEGMPKTPKSVREIKMLDPVVTALQGQAKQTWGKSDYVFLNQDGRPLNPNPVNFYIWKPALKKAGLKPRPLYQTRHTFATLMLDAGEKPGWVQTMMGHETLQMILERYYSHVKSYAGDDGNAFMDKVYRSSSAEKNTAVAG